METMISLERAMEIVLNRIKTVAIEQLQIGDSYRRVLAENVVAKIAMPPFDRSPLDGYAYRSENPSAGNSNSLRIIEEIPAGKWPEKEIAPGECARIFTGAPIPSGANCVVRQEDAARDGEWVTIKVPVQPGENIVRLGEEIKQGDVVLPQGTLLTSAAVGLMAALGIEAIPVYCRPKVGLLATGSELIEAGEALLPGKIYNSNTYTLKGLLLEAGCQVSIAPIASDTLEEITKALLSLGSCDCVITTGGASVGEYDLIPDALRAAGCEMLFWKVNLKPGTPAAVAVKGDCLYFSLSGNPAAAMVTYELIVYPALGKLKGQSAQERVFPVKLVNGFAKSGKQRRFLRARALLKDGEIWADIEYAQGSGVLRSMIGSQLLLDVPGGYGAVKPGDELLARWTSEREEI